MLKIRSGRFAGHEGTEVTSNAGTVRLKLTNGETTTEYWSNVVRITATSDELLADFTNTVEGFKEKAAVGGFLRPAVLGYLVRSCGLTEADAVITLDAWLR